MAKRGGKRRDPAREKFWRRTVRDQQRSGLSVRDFCLRQGLKDWTFRWWRQELARRDQASSVTTSGERIEAAPAFLPVRVVDLEVDLEVVSPRPAPPIEILLPTGMIVRAPSGFDPHTLGHVLAVLEGRPC
jgi:transposase